MVRGRGKSRAKQGAHEPPRERVFDVVETVARHLTMQPWAPDLTTQEVADALSLTPDDASACLAWCEEQGMVTSSPHPDLAAAVCWRATRQGFAFLVAVIESEQAPS